MKINKITGVLIIIIVLIVILVGGGFIYEKQRKPITHSCPIKIEEKIVRGDSMSPLIKNGQTITVLKGYYNCHKVKRNDVILLRYAGNKNPLIKIVKAIPGDSWHLENSNGCYHIIVNGNIVKNSEGKNYCLSGKKAKMLQLYASDYPIIPQNAYLVLGNKVEGTMDSTRFGLLGKDNIIGKVKIKN